LASNNNDGHSATRILPGRKIPRAFVVSQSMSKTIAVKTKSEEMTSSHSMEGERQLRHLLATTVRYCGEGDDSR
jgi:hypothetical protein